MVPVDTQTIDAGGDTPWTPDTTTDAQADTGQDTQAADVTPDSSPPEDMSADDTSSDTHIEDVGQDTAVEDTLQDTEGEDAQVEDAIPDTVTPSDVTPSEDVTLDIAEDITFEDIGEDVSFEDTQADAEVEDIPAVEDVSSDIEADLWVEDTALEDTLVEDTDPEDIWLEDTQEDLGPDTEGLSCKTFETHVQPIFDAACTNCHNSVALADSLDLTSEASMDALVNVPSMHNANWMLVSPGDSQQSYLMEKMGNAPSVGQTMPLFAPSLGEDDLETIAAWIDAGANLWPFACVPEGDDVIEDIVAPEDIVLNDAVDGDAEIEDSGPEEDTSDDELPLEDAWNDALLTDEGEEVTDEGQEDVLEPVEDAEDGDLGPEDDLAPPPDPEPAELVVTIDDLVIQSGDVHDFGEIAAQTSSPLLIVSLENIGDLPLALTADLAVVGSDASEFFVLYPPEGIIEGGGSTSFAISYTPNSEGSHQAFATFAHDGLGETPFGIELTGLALPPPEPTPLYIAWKGCCTRWLSTDGENWTRIDDAPGPDPVDISEIVFAGNRFVGVGGNYSPGTSRFVHTTTGIYYEGDYTQPWNIRSTLLEKDGVLVSGGANGNIVYSENKGGFWSTFETKTGASATSHYHYGLASPDGLIIIGQRCIAGQTPETSIALSQDGKNWDQWMVDGRCIGSMSYGNGIYVGMGQSMYNPDMDLIYWDCATSTDLVTWTPCTQLFDTWEGLSVWGAGTRHYGFLNGEFLYSERGYSNIGTRSVDGLNWDYFDWGASRPPDTLIYEQGQYLGFAWTIPDEVGQWGCYLTRGDSPDNLTYTDMNLPDDECPDGVVFGYAPPYFDIEEALVEPSLEVEIGGQGISSGDTVDFAQVASENYQIQSITLTNSGEGILQFLSNPTIAISGADVDQFAWVGRPSASVLPGQSTTIDVMFKPTSLGTKNATLTFTTDDPTTPDYILELVGESVTPTEPLPRFVSAAGGGNTDISCCARWVSNDGITWNETVNDPPADGDTYYQNFRDMQFVGGVFYGAGGGGLQSRNAISHDGLTWTFDVLDPAGSWQGGAGYVNGVFVSAGGNGQARYSLDNGATWQQTNVGISNHRRNVTSGDDRVLALGDAEEEGSYASITLDGINWESVLLPGMNLYQPAFGNGVFVANSNVADEISHVGRSIDGLNWTPINFFSPNMQLVNLGFHNGQFILREANAYYTSPDGVTWTLQPFWIPDLVVHRNGLWVGIDGDTFYYGSKLNDLFVVPDVSGFGSRLMAGTRPAP